MDEYELGKDIADLQMRVSRIEAQLNALLQSVQAVDSKSENPRQ